MLSHAGFPRELHPEVVHLRVEDGRPTPGACLFSRASTNRGWRFPRGALNRARRSKRPPYEKPARRPASKELG